MPAVRVWTGSAWQDLAIAGPAGAIASGVIEAWHVFGAAGEPTLAGSTSDGAEGAPAFRKTPDGRVQFRGIVTGSSSTLCTLPVGYRPPARVSIPIIYWNGSAWVSGRVIINTTGVVTTISNVETLASLAYIPFDVIEFDTGQATFPLGGLAMARGDVVYTTASLAPNGLESGLVALGLSYRVIRVVTSRPARVRLYTTVAKRNADSARLVTADPVGDHGLMMEIVTSTGQLTYDLTPNAFGSNLETIPSGNIPIIVENFDSSTGTVTVTLTRQSWE